MKKTTSQSPVTGETIGTEKKVLILKEDVTTAKLKRKLTNEAKKQAVKDAKDDERKLSTHYKKLTKFASDYVRLLSDEVGKPITAEQISGLKYSDFLPFLTIREEYSNTTNGWTFPRLLNVVSRFFRGEKKSQVSDSILSDVE
jgi:adenosyl cobinamide kinase/adenosyl cobinamide phosphate guanylyltransferase